MSKAMMKDVQQFIKERTVEMESEDYAAFMRELGEWVQMQADMAEYDEELYRYAEND